MHKYFGTDGIRGKVGEGLITEACFLHLGAAIAKVLYNNTVLKPSILIGRDTRESGEWLERALIQGLTGNGVNCLRLDIIPTPIIGFLTPRTNTMAGLVISASHNPPDQNGLKIFSAAGLKLPEAIEYAIESAYDSHPLDGNTIQNNTGHHSYIGRETVLPDEEGQGIYIAYCKTAFPNLFETKELKIILDCANGATYQLAPKVLQDIGKEILKIGVTPNGNNINTNCGATKLEALKSRVVREQADLGIAFDGDGDRLMMIDNSGEIVDGDELLFIIAANLKQHQKLVGGVVGTVMSNMGLELSLKKMGIEFMRSDVGDHNVYALLADRNWHLGGEPSGHILNLDRTTTGDGILAALQILDIMRKTKLSLLELKRGMIRYPQILINIQTVENSTLLNNPKVKKAIRDTETQLKNLNGRLVVRYSGTEPLLRVMLEGEDSDAVQDLAHNLAELIKSEQG